MHEIRIAEDLSLILLETSGREKLLGESFKLAVVSTTEGDDKPAKYPMLFREAKGITQFPKGAYLEAIF